MTNVEVYQATAKKAYEKGLLNNLEQDFYEDAIEGKDKKGLRNLSSEQFKLLRRISKKYDKEVEE